MTDAPVYGEMNAIVHRMIVDIEMNYCGGFYFHSLPEIACVAFAAEMGADTKPNKKEINDLCTQALGHLRTAYPYTRVELSR